MNLYLISQDENLGYDTFDSAVVAAESEDAARKIHPGSGGEYPDPDPWDDPGYPGVWCQTPEAVNVKFIGVAADGIEAGVVLASFHAG